MVDDVRSPEQTKEEFKTPEEVADEQDLRFASQKLENQEPLQEPQQPMNTTNKKRKLNWPPGNKEYLLIGLLLVLIAGGIAFYISSHSKTQTVSKVAVKKVAPKPKTVASTLSGLQVDPEVNKRPVTGVMIENSQDARPQSGLSEAKVVFEAIAEGGITRFLALFQDTSPENVGPIRSARPYYVQWAIGFDAGYAHVGGSPEALANIKTWGARDLDQFANGGSYHRVASRAAPHNVYTSIASLNQLEAGKGYGTSTFTGFSRFKAKPIASKTPTAKTIDIKISGPVFNVHYDFNAPTNSYNRSEGGAAHIDANTNAPISPNVVVAIVLPYSIAGDGYHSQYQTLGTGQAFIFQNGNVVVGSWTKVDNKSQISFTDAAGKIIMLNPGQTWITAVGSTGAVTYSP